MSALPPALPPEGSRGVSAVRPGLGPVQFTALLALSFALIALAIDLMLPAFDVMRADLGLAPDATAITGVVTLYLVGLAAGQLVYGPLSDRFGRKRILYSAYSLYGVAAFAAALAPNLEMILLSRLVWGLGAAGIRVVGLAVIRDSFEGERMSRAMSLVFAVFLIVPMIAPTIGAGVVAVGSWRWLFAACVLAAVAMATWATRLPETLRPEHRLELRFDPMARAVRFVVSNRSTVGYTLATTVLFGAFASYLASSEAIFGQTFGQAGTFPFIFGGLAVAMSLGTLVSARLVSRIGMRRLSHVGLVAYVGIAAAATALALATDGRPPLSLYLVGLAILLFGHALLIPNFNTIAMEPMAPVAGTASSVIGAAQMGGGAILGGVIDRTFDGSVLPLSVGFLAVGVLALGLITWAEGGRLFAARLVPEPEMSSVQ